MEDERDMYQVNTAVVVMVVMMRIMLKMMTWRGNERRRGWRRVDSRSRHSVLTENPPFGTPACVVAVNVLSTCTSPIGGSVARS